MRLSLRSRLVVIGAVLLTAAAMPTASPAAQRSTAFDERAFNQAMDDFTAHHQDDWIGLQSLWARFGIRLLSVDIPRLNLHGVSAQAAQHAVAAEVRSPRARGHAAALPPDTFNVSGAIGQRSDGRYVVQGNWDFKGSFAGGETPDDIALLSVRSKCWTISNTAWSISDQVGNSHNGLGYIRKNDLQGDIALGVHDSVSGFNLLTAHGNERFFMSNSGCNDGIKAAFEFEHNQSGSTVGIYIAFGLLTVSYNGATVPPLQKATDVFRS